MTGIATLITMTLAANTATISAYSGRWQSNRDRSFWSDGAMPVKFDVVIELDLSPSKFICHAIDRTIADAPQTYDLKSSIDDAVSKSDVTPNINEVRVRYLANNVLQILEQKDGDVIVGQYWSFASDGRSFVRWGVGKSTGQKSRAFYEWYDRIA